MKNICLGISLALIASPFSLLSASGPVYFGSASPDPAHLDSVEQAAIDFQAVLAGDRPVHAVFDRTKPLPADGGTHYFQGNGYSLSVLKSLSTLAGVHGFFYGPVVRFDEGVVSGNYDRMSSISFYSIDEMRKLLSRRIEESSE